MIFFLTLFTNYSILLCIVAPQKGPHDNFLKDEHKNQSQMSKCIHL